MLLHIQEFNNYFWKPWIYHHLPQETARQERNPRLTWWGHSRTDTQISIENPGIWIFLCAYIQYLVNIHSMYNVRFISQWIFWYLWHNQDNKSQYTKLMSLSCKFCDSMCWFWQMCIVFESLSILWIMQMTATVRRIQYWRSRISFHFLFSAHIRHPACSQSLGNPAAQSLSVSFEWEMKHVSIIYTVPAEKMQQRMPQTEDLQMFSTDERKKTTEKRLCRGWRPQFRDAFCDFVFCSSQPFFFFYQGNKNVEKKNEKEKKE